jgi:hypothetical protein
LLAFVISGSVGRAAADAPPPNPANVFAAPMNVRPLKIAIYEGDGSG